MTLRLLIIGFLFVTAFCLRLYGLVNPPMDFVPVRQYHSALLARGFYEWLLAGNLVTFPSDGIIEPPILELVSSFAYRIFGEHLWIPRLLSAMFWMVGGAFLYQIAKKISSPNAAMFSVFFYLFVPFSVFASRAFMPDPLMIMLLLISIFTIVRYHEQPSPRRMLIAAIASSLAVFVKPVMCFFQIFGAFISLAVYRRGVRKSLTSPHLLMFTALSILPSGLYYLYGTFIAGFLKADISNRAEPSLLLEPDFWRDWVERIGDVVGYTARIGALLGVLLFRAGLPKALTSGLWGGYLLFGLVFTVHIYSHTYYSLQLIPIVALSLGSIGDLVIKQLNQLVSPNFLSRVGLRYYGRAIVLALFISALVFGAREHRDTLLKIANQDHLVPKYAHDIAIEQEIGEVVNHSRHTLLLFGNGDDFGFPLEYHGRLSGVQWPRLNTHTSEVQQVMRGLSAEELFNTLYLEHSPEYFNYDNNFNNNEELYEHSPEYFIISTELWKSEEYKDLRDFLTKSFPLMVQDDDYVVFDLRNKP